MSDECFTERELALSTIRTMHALARLCHEKFRAEATRKSIMSIEHAYHQQLMPFEDSRKHLSDSTRRAWLEWDEDTRRLLGNRGGNPDLLLQRLDMYPKLVLEVHLGVRTPGKSLKPA